MKSNSIFPQAITIGKSSDFTDNLEQISFEEFITQELEYFNRIVFVN